MFNQNSPIIQDMINNGQFGTQMPLQSYNPYEVPQYNNIMPISQIGYNQQYNQQQLPQNSYVFAPAVPNDYQHPYMGNNNYANPQYNYYDPYGMNNQSQYGYNNPYATNYYGMNQYQYNNTLIKQQQKMMKLKYQIAAGCFGKSYTDEQLENMVNPKREQPTPEQIRADREFEEMAYYNSLMCQPPLETQAMRTARYIADCKANIHEAFDNHSLREFLDNDLWKLQREFWIEENVKSRGRDLSTTYSSDDYNELLNMHRSSNPYINELLDTSRYDNNLDDMEIGLPQIMDAQRRRKQILEGRVPSFISSDETIRRRHQFTSQILNQITRKGGNNSV